MFREQKHKQFKCFNINTDFTFRQRI
uniref:Uncharacterized protein n=1 Tax=Rhizophora mucronata TaxID=61149 RepID=A0A2P2N4E6_RHIMU